MRSSVYRYSYLYNTCKFNIDWVIYVDRNRKEHLRKLQSYNIDDSVVLCQRTRCEVPPNPSEVSSLSSALGGEHERRVDGNGGLVCVISIRL